MPAQVLALRGELEGKARALQGLQADMKGLQVRCKVERVLKRPRLHNGASISSSSVFLASAGHTKSWH